MARLSNIKLRRSATAGAVPLASNLDLGELALNTYDGKLYMKKSVSGTDTVVQIGGIPAASDILKEYRYVSTSGQTTFSGNDSNSQSLLYIVGAIEIYLNGILLDPSQDFTANTGNTVVLTSGAATGDILQLVTWHKTIGTGSNTVQQFTGDGSAYSFTLSTNPVNEAQTLIYINGVYQNKSAYTIAGTSLDFGSGNAPVNGAVIEVVINSSNLTAANIADLTISGNFTTNTISASGTITGNLTGNVTGNTSGSAGTVSSFSGRDTDDLNEGSSNLYYTTARFNAALSSANTGSLSEGSNLYYTNARARGAISVTDSGGDGSLAYNNSTGVITYTGPSASEVRAHFSAGSNITISGTGVIAGSAAYADSNARAAISVTDSGGDGSLAYNSSTGVITYTGPSAAEVRAHLSAGTGMSYSGGAFASTITQYTTALARATISVTDAGGDGSLAYNNSTGVITYTGPSAAEVRAHISVTDSGGDGSLSYSAGVITYTGPSASEVQAHISAGTGVAISSGAISIGQAVATTSDVTFNDVQVDGDQIITGNLTVNGTQTNINTATLSVEDLNITVGKLATTSTATNGAGLTFGAWSVGTIPTLTWDHSNTRFAMNKTLAANIVGNVTGNTSGTSGSTTGNAATVTNGVYTTGAQTIAGVKTFSSAIVSNLTGNVTGNASTATALATARTIGGTSFDGTANIAVALSATSTALATARTIGGVSFDGTANINLPGVNASGTQDTSGNAATATTAGTVTTAAQPAITSLGSLTGLDVNGAVTINDNLSLDGSNKELRFYEGVNYVGFEAPALSADQIWVLPTADGTAGYALKTDGSGNLSWGLAGGNAFETIAVSGQSSLVADSSSDTLTIAAGTGITLATTAGTDTLTITNSAVGANAFGNIAVLGQSTVAADSTNDTLNIIAGAGMSILTNAGTDTITIAGAAGTNPLGTQLHTSTNGQSAFAIGQTPANEDALMVFVEGVYQNKNSYTISGSTLTFDSGLVTGDEVVIHSVANGINGTGHNTDIFTGNASTYQFTLSIDPQTENNCFVFWDGVYQQKNQFTVSGNTLDFGSGNVPPTGTYIEVITPTVTAINVPTTGSVVPNSMSTGGPSWDSAGAVTISESVQNTVTTNITNTTATTILSLPTATFRSAKVEISISDATSSDYEFVEVGMVHNGSVTSSTVYGQVFTGAAENGTITSTYASGNMILQFTSANTNTLTIKAKYSALKV